MCLPFTLPDSRVDSREKQHYKAMILGIQNIAASNLLKLGKTTLKRLTLIFLFWESTATPAVSVFCLWTIAGFRL